MYDSPRRRGGQRGAGACARQAPVMAHEGSCRDFLRRHQAVHGNKEMKQAFVNELLERTADPRNLRLALQYLVSHGGAAPGVDGMRPDDLDDSEAWELARTIGKAILDDTYRISPDRKLRILKASGKGYRWLSIPTTVDRMVQRSVVQIVQPYIDPMFDEHSLGYRPGKDRQDALVLAERIAVGADRWNWATEDVKDAFNQVPQRRLLDIVRRTLSNGGTMRLMERLVLTGSGRGIRQGGNLSPLLLNRYLDHFLDKIWRHRHRNIPLIRVADDLLLLCRCRQEAEQAYADLKELLRVAAMPLKGTPETTIRELGKGDSATWLGYQIRKRHLHHQGHTADRQLELEWRAHGAEEQSQHPSLTLDLNPSWTRARKENRPQLPCVELDQSELEVRLTEESWVRLARKLSLAHLKADAPLRAIETVQGWVEQQGPCLPQVHLPTAYARIRATALGLGFDELPSLKEVRTIWQDAYALWCSRR